MLATDTMMVMNLGRIVTRKVPNGTLRIYSRSFVTRLNICDSESFPRLPWGVTPGGRGVLIDHVTLLPVPLPVPFPERLPESLDSRDFGFAASRDEAHVTYARSKALNKAKICRCCRCSATGGTCGTCATSPRRQELLVSTEQRTRFILSGWLITNQL
jgi:hypothetical protein